jgi:hypothetical protein
MFISFFAIKKKRKTTLCLRRLSETAFPNLPHDEKPLGLNLKSGSRRGADLIVIRSF